MDAEFEIRPGTVLSTEPGRIMVRLDKEEMEGGGCGTCSLKILCRDRSAEHLDIPVTVPAGKEPSPGDRVDVQYRSANPAAAAAVLFLPPLAGLTAGGWAAASLFAGNDWFFLAGTALGFCLGLALTYAINRAFRAVAPKTRLAESDNRTGGI